MATFSPVGQLHLIDANPTALEIVELRSSNWPQQYPPGTCLTIPGGAGVDVTLDSPNLFAPPYNLPTTAKAVVLQIKAKCKIQTGEQTEKRPEATLYVALTYAGDPGPVNAVCDASSNRRQSGPNSPGFIDGTSASLNPTQINFSGPIIRLNRTVGSPDYGKFKVRRITSLILWAAPPPPPTPSGYNILQPYNFSGVGFPVLYIDLNIYLVGFYA